MRDQTTKRLYQNRLSQKLKQNYIQPDDDVELGWRKVKENMESAAEEALGYRKVNKNARRNNKVWFTEEVKILAEEKRNAHKKYRNINTREEYHN